jgi:hypothetical protein
MEQSISQFSDENTQMINENKYLLRLDYLSTHVNKSVAKAILEIGNLPDSILNLEGMSSHGNRILLNHICSINGKYLEIGSWKGSTFISALYKNTMFGTSIDNHQPFKDSICETSENELKDTCSKYLINGEKYELITADSFGNDLNLKGKYNVYFYDGGHTYEDHYRAITHFYNNLESMFIYICDDYSMDHIEKGTKDAFRDMDIQVITEFKLFGNQVIPSSTTSGFWNGLYVSLCVKKKSYPEFFKKEKYAHSFARN